MLRPGDASSLVVYEDVASSIEPGQRCQMQGTLSTTISGLRPHNQTGLPLFAMVDREI